MWNLHGICGPANGKAAHFYLHRRLLSVHTCSNLRSQLANQSFIQDRRQINLIWYYIISSTYFQFSNVLSLSYTGKPHLINWLNYFMFMVMSSKLICMNASSSIESDTSSSRNSYQAGAKIRAKLGQHRLQRWQTSPCPWKALRSMRWVNLGCVEASRRVRHASSWRPCKPQSSCNHLIHIHIWQLVGVSAPELLPSSARVADSPWINNRPQSGTRKPTV